MIEIKTGDVPCCVYVSDVKEHKEFKNKFLEFLSYNNVHGFKTERDNIYNTDFFVKTHPSTDNSYVDLALPFINKHNYALYSFLGYTTPIETDNIWFQQYKKSNQHSWHRHKLSIFSNVYYVDLHEESSKTTFRFLGKEFHVEVKEGQILTFPSFLEHCSKPNASDKIKTVISFNSS
jgi:hypothetical protein